MKKKSIVCMLTMALLLGGCGSSSSSSAPASSEPAKESQTEENQAQAIQKDPIPAVSEVVPQKPAQSEVAQETAGSPVDEQSLKVIQEHGYVEDYTDIGPEGMVSSLVYNLKTETLQDIGEYYTVDAIFLKTVDVSVDTKVGDKITVVVDDFTGETLELVCEKEGYLVGADDTEYYFHKDDPRTKNGETPLMHDSDDFLLSPFYEGKLCISKDARAGAVLDPESIKTVSEDTLTEYNCWFNSVFFNADGVVVGLLNYGD